MAEKQNGSWAIQKREKTQKARYSVVLLKEAAETHQLMALPYGKFKPTIVKIRDVP
jgi:hypothetical protein